MAVTYLGRQQWGGGPLRAGHKIDHARFTALAVHHTVAILRDYDRDGFLHGDLDDIGRYMRTLQVSRPDLGPEVPYSFVVFRGQADGSAIVAEGRGFGVTGAHTAGHNSSRYGVAYAGNASDDTMTPGLIEGFRWVGQHLAHPESARPTIGHRDVKATECPGKHLYASLRLIQPPFFASPIHEEDSDMEAQFILGLYAGFFNVRPGDTKPDGKPAIDAAGFNFWLKAAMDGTPRDQIRASFAKVAGV